MDIERLPSAIPAVLHDFGLGTLQGTPRPVTGGMLNWNFDVATGSGRRLFLRCYRERLTLEQITGEHTLLDWLGVRGIPAPAALRRANESTVVEHDGARWSVFPWVEGVPPLRGAMTAAQVRALGAMHGRVQAVLATHPRSIGATMTLTWDAATSQDMLSLALTAATERGAETWILDGMRQQLALLETYDILPVETVAAALPSQLIHGDFHDQQMILDGDRIAAVVDWELWRTDPRAWELVRSMAFSMVLETDLLEPYLEGYREYVSLSEAECRLALRLWWQSRVVGGWVWIAYFLQGNERVGTFFEETIAALARQRDNSWRESIEERFVRAVRG